MSPPNPTRRVRRGSGHEYYLDGEKVDAVSWIIREGVPSPQFAAADVKRVAGYAVDNWGDLEQLTPSKRYDALVAAKWAERDAAAVRGTAIHKLAEQLAAGVEVDVEPALVGHVDGYLRFVDEYDVVDLAVEQTVIYRGASTVTSYMGTFDLLAELGGVVWLIDWKTGASGIWPDAALQLAAYANAQTLLADDGTERPLPPIERAGAVHLRADGYALYPLDVGPATFRTFQYAQQLAHYKQAPRESYVGEALAAPSRAAS